MGWSPEIKPDMHNRLVNADRLEHEELHVTWRLIQSRFIPTQERPLIFINRVILDAYREGLARVGESVGVQPNLTRKKGLAAGFMPCASTSAVFDPYSP